MKLLVKKGKTSKRAFIFIQDSSKTTGAGLTGLTNGSAGLVCYRAREDDGNAGGTRLALAAGTLGTWSSGGFAEKDSANMPGVYELGLDNAGLATGSDTVVYVLEGATNMAPCVLEIQLVDWDPQSSTLGVSYPANFSALGITAGGHVSNVDTLTTYTGDTPQTGDVYGIVKAGGGGDAAAIKAKTDQLTFTTANVIDAGVRYVNGVKVNGSGTSGSPWGP